MATEIPNSGGENGPIQPPTGPTGPKGGPLGDRTPGGIPPLDGGRPDKMQLPKPFSIEPGDSGNPLTPEHYSPGRSFDAEDSVIGSHPLSDNESDVPLFHAQLGPIDPPENTGSTPEPGDAEGPDERAIFESIVTGSGLEEVGSDETARRRRNIRVTHETVASVLDTMDKDEVPFEDSINMLLTMGVFMHNLHEDEVPVIERNRITGEERPFDTSTSMDNVTRDTQLEIYEGGEHPVYGVVPGRFDTRMTTPMSVALELFMDRFKCDEETAFNALIRTGHRALGPLRDEDRDLVRILPDGKPSVIAFEPYFLKGEEE